MVMQSDAGFARPKKPAPFASPFQAKAPGAQQKQVANYVLKPGASQIVNGPSGSTRYSGPAAAGPAAPVPNAGFSGGGGYSPGTSLGTSATGAVGVPASVAAPAPMSDEDWWNQDQDYLTEKASLENTQNTALEALKAKRANYDTDFLSTLKNLGWDWQGDDTGDLSQMAGGHWDEANKLGAYGQGYQNLNNDFASRGLMDSSFFGDALTNFNTDFNNQFKNIGNSRTAFQRDNGDNTGAGLAARNEYQNALARAQQSSLARRQIAV